jgi:hypothetical protein
MAALFGLDQSKWEAGARNLRNPDTAPATVNIFMM